MEWWNEWPFDYPLTDEERQCIASLTNGEINRTMSFIQENHLWEYVCLAGFDFLSSLTNNDVMIEWMSEFNKLRYAWSDSAGGVPVLLADGELGLNQLDLGSFEDWTKWMIEYVRKEWREGGMGYKSKMLRLPAITPEMVEEWLNGEME